MALKIESLKSIPFFSGLSPAELESTGQLMFEKRVERGEVVLFESEPAEALFFVAFGAVKLFKTSSDGKEQILGIVRPGESFNSVPMFDEHPNPASAQAMGPVLLYGIKRDELKVILRNHPQLAPRIIQALAEEVRRLTTLVEDLSFKPVISRVAKILLENARDSGNPGPQLTQQEMAALAGTVREVVGRTLKILKDEGAIRLERHRIVIADKEALKEMAEAPY